MKRYNILVPGIFPLKPPSVDADLPQSTRRKLEKLHEYIQNNPKNTSKVSRRLERRIRHELKSKSGTNLGYVKIAVHAYVYLLWHSQVKDVVLYAQELIIKDNPVIEMLLTNKEKHLQILGAELLAHFLKKQSDETNFSRLEEFVPLVCGICRDMSSETAETREERQIILELRVACLRSLREHVALMHKLSVPLGEEDGNIEDIMACVLDNLDSKEILNINLSPSENREPSVIRPSSPVGRFWSGFNNLQPMQTFRSRRTHHESSTSFDFRFSLRMTNVGEDFFTADGPGPVAAQVLRELGNLTRAARSAEKIINVLLRQLDERHGWLGTEIVGTAFDVMHDAFAREHQQFLLFKILLRHASQATYLPFQERIALITRSLEEGLSQDSQISVLVLSQSLECLHRQLPKPRMDSENELIPAATDFSPSIYKDQSGLCKLAPLQQATTAEQDEKTLRSVVLCGIVEMARRVEGAIQLVDTLLGVLDKREQVLLNEDESMQKEINISLLECLMAAAEALADLPEEAGRLPTRKFDDTICKLLGIVSDLPPAQTVYVQGILRLILPLGPKDTPLSEVQTTSVLSSMYESLKHSGNNPHNFSELSALFYTLMTKSTVRGWIKGLKFVHTIWSEALDRSSSSRFNENSAAHILSVLFLANQCIVSLGMLLGAPKLSEARLPLVEETVNPNLKPSRQFAGVLAYTTGGYSDQVVEKCEVVLGKLREELAGVKLEERLIQSLEDNELVKQEFGDTVGDVIRGVFIPEGHLLHNQRQKIGITRKITPSEAEPTEDIAEELRGRISWMLPKSNSSRHSDVSSPGTNNSLDLPLSRYPSLRREGEIDTKTSVSEKSKEDILQEVLRGSSEFQDEDQALTDHELENPPIGFMP